MSMRHNCESSGCFIKVGTVDWGFLDNAFSGKIKVGDIDGIVEANGHLLILEWKKEGVEIPTGQMIMFKKATKINHLHVFVINGNPITNTVSNLKVFKDGGIIYDSPFTNDLLINHCARWEAHVRNINYDYSEVA